MSLTHTIQIRIWWTDIPPGLPMPAMLVGIDVYHAPMMYDPKTKQRMRKSSCAGIVIQVVSNGGKSDRFQLFTQAFRRMGGEEYGLRDQLKETVSNACRLLNVRPASVVVWRDGIGTKTISTLTLNLTPT